MTITPPVLEMAGITKRFSGVVALDQVNLTVGQGEVVALIGENGAGKSTLMKILGGVHAPDAGTIRVGGTPVIIRSVGDAMARGIGFVHQELNVLDNLDIAGNVFLGREPVHGGPLRLIDRKRLHAETDALLERLGIGVSSRTSLAALSLAQRQMVEIARALSQNARLVLMDEPTSSLTLSETERLLQVVTELRAQGVSIIYISHRLGEVEQIADRVEVLRDGKNAGTLTGEGIRHDALVTLMVGRDIAAADKAQAAATKTPRFQVRGLQTARYPERTVSFSIGAGEILGFAGLVGAGRTEVAQALFGVERARGGSVLLDNKAISITSPQDAIASGIYLIPEDRRRFGLITDMVLRENVTLPALRRVAPAGLIQRGAEQETARNACGSLNVKAPSVEATASTLSGGNQQKVVLAKWLSLGPKVLLFDEPTRGIDVGAKAEIYEQMRTLARAGAAILMISSDMEEILHVSDRVAVMHEGGITGVLDRADFSEEAIMRLAVGRTEKAKAVAAA